MNLVPLLSENTDQTNKMIDYYLMIIAVSVLSILSTINFIITIIELRDEIENIKKYVSSLTNIENYNYKETKTKISLIMDNVLSFQEEHDKNIIYAEEKYQTIESKINNKDIEYQKQIEEIRKELKAKDEQYKNIENKFNKLSEEFNNKNIEHQKQVKENKKLAINIYYYWKSAHNIHPGLISMYDIIDGIYKHFYDTTFNIENNISQEILEETIPFLLKKREQFFDNKIFR